VKRSNISEIQTNSESADDGSICVQNLRKWSDVFGHWKTDRETLSNLPACAASKVWSATASCRLSLKYRLRSFAHIPSLIFIWREKSEIWPKLSPPVLLSRSLSEMEQCVWMYEDVEAQVSDPRPLKLWENLVPLCKKMGRLFRSLKIGSQNVFNR